MVVSNYLLLQAIEAHDYTEAKYALEQGASVDNPHMLSTAAKTGRVDIVSLLLSHGAKAKGVFISEPIFHLSDAIEAGHNQVVEKLLLAGADIDGDDLLKAVKLGNEKMVRLLLNTERGRFSLDQILKAGECPELLYAAVESGSIELVKFLHQFDKRLNYSQKDPLLLKAVNKNNSEMVRTLIGLGADINILPTRDHCYKISPLGLAVRQNKLKMVQLLLNLGANVHSGIVSEIRDSQIIRLLIRHGFKLRPEDHYTPLHQAAGDGDLNTLRTLLDRSELPINSDNPNFGTPLCEAVRNGQCKAAKLLITHGANVNFITRDGSPLLIAVKAKQYATAELLLSKGANVNHTSANRNNKLEDIGSPLQVAASQGSVEIVRLLLEYKADVGLEKGENRHPLGEAALHGHLEIMKILLQYGADVNQKSHFKDMALHSACELNCSNSAEVVHLLLDNGANTEASNETQGTPLLCAATYGMDRAARALLNHPVNLYASKDGKTAFHKANRVSILNIGKGGEAAQARIYQMLRAKEVLSKTADLQDLFKKIIQVGLDGLEGHELSLLYAIKSYEDLPIDQFAAEFQVAIKKANKLFLYARSGNSYLQRALRSAGLPPEIAAHAASFVSTEHLPYDRGGNTWLNKISKPGSSKAHSTGS